MINIPKTAEDFFATIPDETLIQLAIYDWDSLNKLCIALSLDLQIIEEYRIKKLLKS